MSYWCDDYRLFLEQRRLDEEKARAERKIAEKRKETK
jgi:hypothetical protein